MTVHGVDRRRRPGSRALAAGHNVVPGVPTTAFDAASQTGRLRFTTDPAVVADAEVVLICVPTPVVDHRPDLSVRRGRRPRRRAAPQAGHAGRSWSRRPTRAPPSTCCGRCSRRAACRPGADFALAYSPERIDPGNPKYGLRNTPRIVGGIDDGRDQARRRLLPAASSTRSRQLSVLPGGRDGQAAREHLPDGQHRAGQRAGDALRRPGHRRLGGHPAPPPPSRSGSCRSTPGPGVGGHCIPLDPTYLSWQSRRDTGRPFRLVELAQDINAQMPTYVATRASSTPSTSAASPSRAPASSALGVTYKPNVGDVRESAAIEVLAAPADGAAPRSSSPTRSSKRSTSTAWTCGGRARPTSCWLGRLRRAADPARRLRPTTHVVRGAALVFDARNALGERRRASTRW